ncbi:hypothetical protein QTP88_001891 [Uroleucon formosanum]
MDQKRHISGAQARKRAIDKKEKEAILLSKIPRLNNFFKQINNITPSCVEDNKLESSNDITITNNCSTTSIQCTASSSDQSIVDINGESEKSELNIIPNLLTQNNTNNFKDPADWTNSNICRNYIAKFGYDQNIDADFTSSKRTYSDYNRYCKRFLIFIPNSGHKSEEMSNVIMDFLNSHNIPIENCRGQSYDYARNMSEYVQCSAHSLNLVGTCAAESCNSATSFFMLLQELYNFFSSSTARWDILKTYLKKNLSVKNLSVTRWSARFDACHALFNSYAFIIEALHSIVDNQKEKAVYKVEANGLLARLKTLEIGLMICIWNSILNRNTCETLAKYFIDDVENSSLLIDECILFSKLISTDKNVKSVLSMYKYIKTKELECMFPNLEIVMRMYLSTAVSNCSGKRAFSVLKRVKSYLRSTMKEERLNVLAIFSIEAELVEKLDFNDTINTFAHQKARKRKV